MGLKNKVLKEGDKARLSLQQIKTEKQFPWLIFWTKRLSCTSTQKIIPRAARLKLAAFGTIINLFCSKAIR